MIKKLVLFTIVFILFPNILNAQLVIKNIDEEGCPPYDSDCYLKDINNILDKYVGIWKFTNSGNEIVIQLKKEVKYRIAENSSYEDLLVGEYKYILNGVEKINTLSFFNDNAISGDKHNISGNVFVFRNSEYCNFSGNVGDEKIELIIGEKEDEFIEGRLLLRKFIENGIHKLEICIYDYTTLSPDEDSKLTIPDGFYIFTKQ